MKDKEKQINEMANDIPYLTLSRQVFVSMTEMKNVGWTLSEEDNKVIAEALVEKGWVKIPEDSVVLSKEEYKKLQKRNADRKRLRNKIAKCKDELNRAKEANKNLLDLFKIEIDKASKETAEKILKPLYDACKEDTYGQVVVDFTILENIAKRFGVEIKE